MDLFSAFYYTNITEFIFFFLTNLLSIELELTKGELVYVLKSLST